MAGKYIPMPTSSNRNAIKEITVSIEDASGLKWQYLWEPLNEDTKSWRPTLQWHNIQPCWRTSSSRPASRYWPLSVPCCWGWRRWQSRPWCRPWSMRRPCPVGCCRCQELESRGIQIYTYMTPGEPGQILAGRPNITYFLIDFQYCQFTFIILQSMRKLIETLKRHL